LEAVAANIPDVGLRFGAETQSHRLGRGDLVEIDIDDHEARIDLQDQE
jgi:hypothetical protein